MPLFCPGAGQARRRAAVLLCLVSSSYLLSCSPTFNWRELRPQGTPLQVLMPCKPEHAARSLPMAGAATELNMHSCDTGGLSFAVAWADLGDPARAQVALAEWPRATLAALHMDPAQADAPALAWDAQVRGAQQVRGLNAQGTGPQGRTVVVRAAYFSRGTQVYQAAVYGPAIPAEVSGTFFEAVQLP